MAKIAHVGTRPSTLFTGAWLPSEIIIVRREVGQCVVLCDIDFACKGAADNAFSQARAVGLLSVSILS